MWWFGGWPLSEEVICLKDGQLEYYIPIYCQPDFPWWLNKFLSFLGVYCTVHTRMPLFSVKFGIMVPYCINSN